MAKIKVLVSDPPWDFGDSLTMSSVKRGAKSNYNTLSIEELKNLPVKDIVDINAVIALWCPSSLIKEGIEVLEAWGFRFTQTHIWVKTKKHPFDKNINKILQIIYELIKVNMVFKDKQLTDKITNILSSSIDDILAFGMGRLFRQTHEVVLMGVRGKIYNELKNKSQRSVHFYPATKHSEKPEALQDMLEKMFDGVKLEMFARRERKGWLTVGLENPSSLGEDIRDSLEKLKN